MLSKLLRIFLTVIALFVLDYICGFVLKVGLDRGLGLTEHSKVLIVGHSHLMMAIDREEMENSLNCHISKHTRSGVGMTERKLMTQMFVESKYSDSLKVVVIGVDPFSFNHKGLSQNAYTLFYPWMEDENVSNYIWNSTSPVDFFVHKMFRLSRFSDDLIKQSGRGWAKNDKNFKTRELTDSIFEAKRYKWAREIKFERDAMNILDETIAVAVNKGIHVILFQAPVHRLVTGFQKERYKKILSYYNELDKKNDLVHFVNYSPYYEEDYSLFFDPIHLNRKGQKIVTERFIKEIQNLKIL